MKSWTSFLIPEDEYKEKRLLYFFSEGAITLFLFLVIMLICNNYFNLSVNTILFSSIAVFLFYVNGRYIISGMEYTDIATEKAYKRELKVIVIKTTTFIVTFISFFSIYMFFIEDPFIRSKWFEMLSLLLSISIIMFLCSYISLKRSYKKNKELL